MLQKATAWLPFLFARHYKLLELRKLQTFSSNRQRLRHPAVFRRTLCAVTIPQEIH